MSVENLQYNSNKKPLIISEYGRHIQTMVDQMILTEDKIERTKKAKVIVDVMINANPKAKQIENYKNKLWNQLNIMSDYKLDIEDKEFESKKEESIPPLRYPTKSSTLRFYGHNIKNIIKVAMEWNEPETKDLLVYTIANYMKRCFINWNKDSVVDEVIFEHLKQLSGGKLEVNTEKYTLTPTNELLKMKLKEANVTKKKVNNTSKNWKRKKKIK